MPDTVLKITDASRRFAGRQALDGVDITVHAGETVALLGPNGAGKTTLMRAAAGRLALDAGSVRTGGGDPATDPVARRALGVVPQSVALYPQLSARDNLAVFARLAGVAGAGLAAAVAQGLARAGLAARARDLLRNLSGGMQRRLNIVAGTLHDPALLLLDEPTVGVDVAALDDIHALLEDLRANGIGMLLTTHDYAQAARLADRVAFMHEGRILAAGSAAELVAAAFGDAKELRLVLGGPPGDDIAAALRARGLRAGPDGLHWNGPLAGGYEALGQLERELAASGAHAAEIGLRDPSLESVFASLLQREDRA